MSRSRPHVATLNHGIRGAESESDVQFVKEIAEKWGLPYTLGRANVPHLAKNEHSKSKSRKPARAISTNQKDPATSDSSVCVFCVQELCNHRHFKGGQKYGRCETSGERFRMERGKSLLMQLG